MNTNNMDMLQDSRDEREQEEVAMCLMMLSRDSAPSKRLKFECTTCNKSFHSYQALGGHRASHKKMKARLEIHTNNHHQHQHQQHECPICLRVFASGQALGGHKRSHQPTINVIPEMRGFLDLDLDLNLAAPAPSPQDTSSVHGLNPWWVINNHDPLVGFI